MDVKKKMSKKRIGWICALSVCIVSMLGSVALLNGQRKNVSADIFHSAQGVAIQKNEKVVAPGIADDRSGLKLSASASGSTVTVADDMRGLFELDFRAYSPTAYSPGNEVFGEKVTNNALSLKKMSIVFTDRSGSGETFKVGIEGASKQNYATPQAYVEVGSFRGGIYTLSEGYSSRITYDANAATHDYSSTGAYGNTTGANDTDRYTTLWRTSFSNTAYYASQVWNGTDGKIDNPISTYIAFDPITMQVYTRTNVDGEQKLIWDLSKEYNDGKKGVVLNSFAEYSVTLEFTEISAGSTADLVVYSLNGQLLAGESYTNSVGANVFANFSESAVSGVKYDLPKPTSYDVLNNEVAGVAVTATLNGEKLPVYNANGEETGNYVEGCYVFPSNDGEMTITYQAKEADDLVGKPLVTVVSVLKTQPTTEFTLLGRMEQGELGVGTVVTVPSATAVNAVSKNAPQVYVTVKKNGLALDGLNGVTADVARSFTLDEVANYTVQFKTARFEDVLTFDINASNSIPAFNPLTVLPEMSRVGDIMTIPGATAVFGGESKVATARICLPDGGVYETNSILFEQYGAYTVTYSAEFNGTTYTKSYNLTVADVHATFTSDSNKGTVTYGSSARYDAVKGLRIDANSADDVFTYSKVLNLSESTKDDLLVEVFNSAPWGSNDASEIIITLTDVYDPTNVLTIKGSNYWFFNVVWVTAAAPEQSFLGWLDGSLSGDPYGTPANYNTYVQMGESREWETLITDYSNLGFKLFYDNAEKAIYTYHGWKGKQKVMDFAGKFQTYPWGGFTTGEVYLSITGIKSVVVSQIYKTDLTEDRSFGGETSIFVDTQGYDTKNLPTAIVGKSYPIFNATAFNTWEGTQDVSVAVFRNYGQPSFLEYEVVNGGFIPDMPGTYSIVYSTRDALGNETIKTLRVTAELEENIQPVYLNVAESAKNVFVGESYTLPVITAMGGGVSDLSKEIIVKNKNGETQSIVRNQFYVATSGEYTVSYRVFDYIGNGEPNETTVIFTVNASVQDAPVLYDVKLPTYVLSGSDLQLPAIHAVDFKTDIKGVKPATTSITATLDGKQVTINSNNVCRPEVGVGETKDLKITYRAQSSHGTTEKEYTVKVVNPGKARGYLWEYFQILNGTFTKSEFLTSGMQYQDLILTSADDNASVQFINPVLAQGFEVSLAAMGGNVDKITVTLYDSLNMTVSVRFDMINTKSGVNAFSINGEAATEYNGSFTSSATGLGFVYSQNSYEVYFTDGTTLGKVLKTEQGEPFNGFPSGKVWMAITYGDVTEEFSLRINKVSLQMFSDRTASSRAGASYEVLGRLPLQFTVGQTITVPAVIAQSIVAPRTTVTMSIFSLDENGFETEVYAPADVATPIDLQLNEYTKYKLVYTIADSFGNEEWIEYVLQPTENVAPVLKVDGNVPTKVKVGETVTLPEGIATDDSTKKPTVKIFVITPSRETYVLDEDRSFVAKEAGQYVVRYWAYDDCYNETYLTYVVIAE